MTIWWRPATSKDRPLLDAFCCCSERRQAGRSRPIPPPDWCAEVQKWLRRDGTAFVGGPPEEDPRLLLLFEGDELIAVASHWWQEEAESRVLNALAVALDRQGSRLPNGNSVSDQMLLLTLADIGARPRTPKFIVGRVDPANVRSQQLVRRFGFELKPPGGGRYMLAEAAWDPSTAPALPPQGRPPA